MEDWGSNSMSDWMSHSNWVGNGMGNGMGNGVNDWAMSNNSWMGNSVGNWMGNDGGSFDNGGSVLRDTLVGHVLNDSVSVVGVFDGLDSSVGKGDGVAAGGGVSVPGLGLLEVGAAVVVVDSVLIGVHWGFSEVGSSGVAGSNHGNSGSSAGDSDKGGDDESLQKV